MDVGKRKRHKKLILYLVIFDEDRLEVNKFKSLPMTKKDTLFQALSSE